MTDAGLQEIHAALPSYEIGRELGRGAFGVVLSGRHRQLGREVAIKQLPAVFAADPTVRGRFLAEARVLATLTHPHVIPVFDYVEQGPVCLLVMEKLTGGTLWDRFIEQGMTPQSACGVLIATCAGLDHAHQHGVLHRDIKPENLLFSHDGVLKVVDFGIAKVLSGEQALATRAGDVLGTPAYMAPEQALGGEVGPGTDVYACGVMLYELLTGRLPFSEDGGPLAIVYRHVHEDPTPILEVAPRIPEALAEVVMTSLARDPAERYPSAEAFAVALGETATDTWGTEWLTVADLPVLATGTIMARATRPSGRTPVVPGAENRATRAPDTVAGTQDPKSTNQPDRAAAPPTSPPASGPPPTIAPSPPNATPTSAPTTPPPPTLPPTPDASATMPPQDAAATFSGAGAGPPTLPPSGGGGSHDPGPGHAAGVGGDGGVGVRVRPAVREHVQGGDARQIDLRELVPVAEAIQTPRFPFVAVLLALAALAATAAVAFLGPAGTWEELPPPGALTVAGVEPTAEVLPELDLAEPIIVVLGPDAPPADTVELALSVAQIPLSTTVSAEVAASDGGGRAQLSLGNARFTAPGTVTADLRLLDGGGETAAWRFGVVTTAQPWLSVTGVAIVVLLLLVVSYAESYLRHLRTGRRKVTGPVALAITGAGFGIGLVGVAWLLTGQQPSTQLLTVVAATGGLAGVAAAIAALRARRRRRVLLKLG